MRKRTIRDDVEIARLSLQSRYDWIEQNYSWRHTHSSSGKTTPFQKGLLCSFKAEGAATVQGFLGRITRQKTKICSYQIQR